jgi:nucleotide-binding universal stress UspA family protein
LSLAFVLTLRLRSGLKAVVEESERTRTCEIMLPTVKKILYLTDLSKNSAYVFRYAIQLAKTFDAKITILHVVKSIEPAMEIPLLIHIGEDAYQTLIKEKEQEIIAGIKSRLQAFTEKELHDDPKGASRVSAILVYEGDPVAEILEMADKLESDLLVMGDHSKSTLAYTFLGSTAEKVLRRIRRPVLVVPIPKEGVDDISV